MQIAEKGVERIMNNLMNNGKENSMLIMSSRKTYKFIYILKQIFLIYDFYPNCYELLS